MRSPTLQVFEISRAAYFGEFLITPLLSVIFTIAALHAAPALWAGIADWAFGFLAWTLTEYALHRWGLHRLPFIRDGHRTHHKLESGYTALSPFVTVTAYALIGLALCWVINGSFAAGFLTGYTWYAIVHATLHHGSRRIMVRGRARHEFHHHVDARREYGITSDLWDIVFGTRRTA